MKTEETQLSEVDAVLARRPEAGTLMNPLAILGDPERATEFLQALDTDKLESLMKLYDQQQEKQAEREFNAALARFQGEAPQIHKDGQGAHGASYSKMETVRRKIDPLLSKQGLSLSFGAPQIKDGNISQTLTVRHIGGHSVTSEPCSLPMDDRLSANATQKGGSASSYAQRYLLKSVLGLVFTDEDDDGQAAGTETITDEQADALNELIISVEEFEPAVKANLLNYVGVESVVDIPQTRLGELQAMLVKKLKKHQN